MGRNNLTGAWGEALAAEYLKKRGYQLIACNYRCRFGEIDLILKNRRQLVFAEVKLRKSDNFAAAREFVDYYKQMRLKATAELYLSQNPTNLPCRFDVVEIYAPEGTNTLKPVINHLEGAFE